MEDMVVFLQEPCPPNITEHYMLSEMSCYLTVTVLGS